MTEYQLETLNYYKNNEIVLTFIYYQSVNSMIPHILPYTTIMSKDDFSVVDLKLVLSDFKNTLVQNTDLKKLVDLWLNKCGLKTDKAMIITVEKKIKVNTLVSYLFQSTRIKSKGVYEIGKHTKYGKKRYRELVKKERRRNIDNLRSK